MATCEEVGPNARQTYRYRGSHSGSGFTFSTLANGEIGPLMATTGGMHQFFNPTTKEEICGYSKSKTGKKASDWFTFWSPNYSPFGGISTSFRPRHPQTVVCCPGSYLYPNIRDLGAEQACDHSNGRKYANGARIPGYIRTGLSQQWSSDGNFYAYATTYGPDKRPSVAVVDIRPIMETSSGYGTSLSYATRRIQFINRKAEIKINHDSEFPDLPPTMHIRMQRHDAGAIDVAGFVAVLHSGSEGPVDKTEEVTNTRSSSGTSSATHGVCTKSEAKDAWVEFRIPCVANLKKGDFVVVTVHLGDSHQKDVASGTVSAFCCPHRLPTGNPGRGDWTDADLPILCKGFDSAATTPAFLPIPDNWTGYGRTVGDPGEERPDRLIVAAGSSDGSVRIFDAAHAETLLTIKDHASSVCGVDFGPEGSLTFASASSDKTIRVYCLHADFCEAIPLATLTGALPLDTIQISASGKYILAAGGGTTGHKAGKAMLWETPTMNGSLQKIRKEKTAAAAAATAAAVEAAAKFAASTGGTADTSQIMAAATEAIKEVTTRNATAKAESAKRKEDEKKATQKLKASASKEDKMKGARQLQQQALNAMKAAAKAAADASAAASQPSSGGGAAASGTGSAMEAAAVAAALASLPPPPPPPTVDKETVAALGDMLTSATDASSKKAAVLTLSALTSTSDNNAEQVVSNDATVTAIVKLSKESSSTGSVDDTAIQLHAATAMANMSEESGGGEKMVQVLLKDNETANAILGSALPSASDAPTVIDKSAEDEAAAFKAAVDDAANSVDASAGLIQKLQKKQLEVETVELVKNLAENTAAADGSGSNNPEMIERLLDSSCDGLIAMVRDNNVQAIAPATQTLKVLMSTAAASSPALKKTKNAIVKALKHVEDNFSVHNPDAAERLRKLAPPDDLIELIDARIAILLKVRDAKMARDAAAASAIAEEHDQQIKALQSTVAVLQQKCRDLETQVGGAIANADALREESARENKALRAKLEDAKKDAVDEEKLVSNMKKCLAGKGDDRIAELELQLQATQQKQNEMDQRLQRVEFMVDEMSVEYLMNREIDEERVLIATDPPLEAFRRGLMSDLSSNLLQKLMGNKGAGNVVGKVAAGAAVGEVLMDTLFGAMPFGVGAVIGGLFKGAALLKDKRDRDQVDAVKAASIFTDVTSVENLLEMSVRAITLRHQEAIRRLENPDANKFGRWCAVAVLMYVLSEDVADTPWHFVEGCLFTLDTFGKVAPKTDDELAAEAEAKAEAHKGKKSILGKISSSLSKAKGYIKGKFKDAFNSAKDGLAGNGPSGKGTLTRFENYDEISFKDLLQQNGMKICDRDGSNAKFFSEPKPESTTSAGSGIEVYTVYKADVLIGPFLEIAENRARIQYTAQNPLPPVSVVSSMQGLPIAAGLTPHSVKLLRLKNTPDPRRTAIAGAGGGPAASSAGSADGAAAADNASASSGGGSKSNTLRKSYELFEFGVRNGVAGGGEGGGGLPVESNVLHSANEKLKRELDKVKSQSEKEIGALKAEMAEMKSLVQSLAGSVAAGTAAGTTAAASSADPRSKESRRATSTSTPTRAGVASTSENQRRTARSKTMSSRVVVQATFVATCDAMLGKKKENVKIWIVGEEQGQKRTLKIYENAKMKKLPLLTVHFANVLQVESTVEKKYSGFIVHQAVAEKQLTLLSDKVDNVDSLKAFFIDADLEIKPTGVAPGGGGQGFDQIVEQEVYLAKAENACCPKGPNAIGVA